MPYLHGNVADEEAHEPGEGDEHERQLNALQVRVELGEVFGDEVLQHVLIGHRAQHVGREVLREQLLAQDRERPEGLLLAHEQQQQRADDVL